MNLTPAYRKIRNIVAATLLAGCATPYAPSTPETVAVPSEPSAQSAALAAYYQDLQYQMRLRGLLMQDDGSAGAVSARLLARNFEAIALYDEYTQVPSGYIRQSSPSSLRRWEKPVRMSVAFGDSVPQSVRQSDASFVASYAARLSSVSGHPITMTTARSNYLVLIAGEDDQAQTMARVRAFVPNISPTTIATLENMPRSRLCMVLAFPSANGSMSYGKAIAIIRAEHPTLLRQSCIHEEVAQGLGLANDSPQARPSIFNDDEEFGFLTRHDEKLLKILYDPRLSIGMTADQARPIVQAIASELAG